MRTRIIAWSILAGMLNGVEIQGQPVAVGMYSVTLEPGLTLVGLHLDYGSDHSISNLFREVPEGTELYQLVGGSFTTNVYRAGAWERPSDALALGEGAYVYNPTEETYSHAFGAEIPTGRLTNFIPAGLSIRASMVPRGGRVTQELGLRLNAFDNLYLLEGGGLKVFTYLPDGTWRPSEPVVQLADAFLINAAQATNWVVELDMSETIAAQKGEAGAPGERLDAAGTVNFANGAQGVDAPMRVAAEVVMGCWVRVVSMTCSLVEVVLRR